MTLRNLPKSTRFNMGVWGYNPTLLTTTEVHNKQTDVNARRNMENRNHDDDTAGFIIVNRMITGRHQTQRWQWNNTIHGGTWAPTEHAVTIANEIESGSWNENTYISVRLAKLLEKLRMFHQKWKRNCLNSRWMANWDIMSLHWIILRIADCVYSVPVCF